jgi:hypothetical protein
MSRAIEKALRDSNIHPAEVEYMNVHGTATPANDLAETRAIQRFFGDHSKRIAGQFDQASDGSFARRRRCTGNGHLRIGDRSQRNPDDRQSS